jgi:hypothetical protein
MAIGEIKIKEIELTQSDGNLALYFKPAFPDLGKMSEEQARSELSIEIDGHRDQMAGEIEIKKRPEKAKLLFVPTKPDWARGNNLEVEVGIKDTSYQVKAKAVYLG